MAQHDYGITNQTFPATRADINNVLSAIVGLNSGTSAPSTTVAGMLWYDTTNGLIKQRNAADSAWVTLFAIGSQGLIPQDASTIYAADSGSSDSYAITLDPAPASQSDVGLVIFKANTANTGAATLNVNSLGAVTIKKNYNSDLANNDILANQVVAVWYDGSFYQMLSPVANVTTITAASQAEQEAGTEAAKYVAPATQHYHPSAAKAWVNFNGTGTVAIRVSHNVSSITDNGTGNYTVNFTTAFSTADYAAAVSAGRGATGGVVITVAPNASNPTASAFRFSCVNNSFTVLDVEYVQAAFFGDL